MRYWRLALPIWLALVLGPAPVLAQPREEPATKFERFTLRKGVVVVREHHTIGQISGEYSSRAIFQVSRAFSPGQRDAFLALRVEVFGADSGSRERSTIGVLDAEEVSSLRAALPHLKQMLATIQKSRPATYTEVEFKGGTLQIGFFVGGSSSLFIQAGGPISGTMAFIAPEKFPALEQLVGEAVAKIEALQRAAR